MLLLENHLGAIVIHAYTINSHRIAILGCWVLGKCCHRQIPHEFAIGYKTESQKYCYITYINLLQNKKIRWVAVNWSKCRKQKWWGHYVSNSMPTISQFLCHFSPQRLLHEKDLLPTLFCFLSFYTLFYPLLFHLFVLFFSWNVCLILSHFCDRDLYYYWAVQHLPNSNRDVGCYAVKVNSNRDVGCYTVKVTVAPSLISSCFWCSG